LTVPVYGLLRAVTRGGSQMRTTVVHTDSSWHQAKHVDAKVLDANVPDEVSGEQADEV